MPPYDMKMCVVGGGNIAHALVAVISRDVPISVVTRQPDRWSLRLVATHRGEVIESGNDVSSGSDFSVIGCADVVFVALPQFAVEAAVASMLPHVREGQTVAFMPAPARMSVYAEALMRRGVRVVAFQRVPFVARIVQYGRIVDVSAPRKENRIVVSDDSAKEFWRDFNRFHFSCATRFMSRFDALAFSNSNPLLHPSRLVVLFRDWQGRTFDRNPLFYGEWTDESSELYIASDLEMLSLMERYGLDLATDYESALAHYEVDSASALTVKLRSIESLNSLTSPMRKAGDVWVPDFQSRYFTEDAPFGLEEMIRRGTTVGVPVPTMRYMADEIRRMQG